MNIRFYIDSQTELPHIYNHNINEYEVEYVLSNPGEDRPGADGSRLVIGQTESGRYLRVIYVPAKNRKSLFVITAYDLKGKTLYAYRKRRRRRYKK